MCVFCLPTHFVKKKQGPKVKSSKAGSANMPRTENAAVRYNHGDAVIRKNIECIGFDALAMLSICENVGGNSIWVSRHC